MTINTAYRSHVGLIRASNQDAVLYMPQKGLYGIADGMGGHNGGDIASQMAVDMLGQLIREPYPEAEKLRKSIRTVNYMIYQRQMNEPELCGMGTTLTVFSVREDRLILEHVGDSRAYRIRNGVLEQMSQDHSLVGEMVRDGILSAEEAALSPYRHVITRAVGTEPDVDVDVSEYKLKAGDRWLICSDGLYEHVTDAEICDILKQNSPEIAADILLNKALEKGGTDNISILISEVTV